MAFLLKCAPQSLIKQDFIPDWYATEEEEEDVVDLRGWKVFAQVSPICQSGLISNALMHDSTNSISRTLINSVFVQSRKTQTKLFTE